MGLLCPASEPCSTQPHKNTSFNRANYLKTEQSRGDLTTCFGVEWCEISSSANSGTSMGSIHSNFVLFMFLIM